MVHAYLPIIEHFDFTQYNAGPENWDAIETDQGEILIANQFGVLVYDGYKWDNINIGGKYHVRAFFKDSKNNRVYIGGDDILGYIEFPSFEEPRFHSLMSKLPKNKTIGSIWKITDFDNDIIFQTSDDLLIYSGNNFYDIKIHGNVRSLVKSKNRLFLYDQNKGIAEYDGVNITSKENTAILCNKEVTVMLPFSNGDLLICDNVRKRFYRYNHKTVKPVFEDLNYIIKNYVFCGIHHRGNFVLGTMDNGYFEITENGKLVENLSIKNGLNGNKVFNIYADSHKNLWLCTENGLDMVSTQIPLRIVNAEQNVPGLAHTATVIDDQVFLLSTWGVFVADTQNIANFQQTSSSFKRWNKIDRPAYFIEKIGTNYCVGDLKGLHLFTKNNREIVLSRKLAQSIQVVDQVKNIYLVGFDKGLALVQITNNQLKELAFYENFKKVNKILPIGDSYIVVNTTQKIHRLSIDLNSLSITHIPLPNLFSEKVIDIFQHRNYLILSTESGTSLYDDNFKRVDPLSFGLNPSSQIEVFFEDNRSNIWIGEKAEKGSVYNHDFHILSPKTCSYKWIVKSCSRLLNDRIHFIKHVDKNIVCLGGYSGFFLVDISSNFKPINTSKLDLNEVVLEDDRGQAQYRLEPNGVFAHIQSDETFGINEIPADFQNIYIEVNNNSYLHSKNNEFKFELIGPIKQTIEFTNNPGHKFSNLLPGHYKLKVSSKDVFGQEVENTLFTFTIKQFWYKTAQFYLGMMVLAVGCIFIFFFIQKKVHNVIRSQLEIEVHEKTTEIESNNAYLRDSISFAKIIQEAHLPKKSIFKPAFDNSYIFNRPKDIVGGDFYFADFDYPNLTMAVADCTGHGVAGGFMTMLAINRIQAIVHENKNTAPKEILRQLNEMVIAAFEQKGEDYDIADGMDIAFINVDTQYRTLSFAGSKRSILIQDEEGIKEIKGNNKSLGLVSNDGIYSEFIIKLKKKQRIFMMTDGITDQFGGVHDKKIGLNRIKQFLDNTYYVDLNEQMKMFEAFMEKWQGETDQIDDMLFIALEV